jgi:hypothetical protein
MACWCALLHPATAATILRNLPTLAHTQLDARTYVHLPPEARELDRFIVLNVLYFYAISLETSTS